MQNVISFAVHSGCLRRCLRSPVQGKRPTPSRHTASTGMSQRVPPFFGFRTCASSISEVRPIVLTGRLAFVNDSAK